MLFRSVILPAQQAADVAGGSGGGAGPQVGDAQLLGRAVVRQDALAGGPGEDGRVGAAVKGGLEARVGAGPWMDHNKNNMEVTSSRTVALFYDAPSVGMTAGCVRLGFGP